MATDRKHSALQISWRISWLLPLLPSLAICTITSLSTDPSQEQSTPTAHPDHNEPTPKVVITRAVLPPPTAPVHLTCEQARTIAAQARDNLAQPPPTVDPAAFATNTADWLDPHGLWSIAPDSPIGPIIKQHASSLLEELIEPRRTDNCPTAAVVGRSIAPWVDSIRATFDKSYQSPTPHPDVFSSATTNAFHGTQPTTNPPHNPSPTNSAHAIAERLGLRTASIKPIGPLANAIHQSTRDRVFPSISTNEWADVVLAAALRAYVILIDPHGAWAPIDEETSLYEVELESAGRRHIWGKMSRTAAGIRIDSRPVHPLRLGDVILSIDDVTVAGLTVEQIEQLGILDPNDDLPIHRVTVLRPPSLSPVDLDVSPLDPRSLDGNPPSSIHVSTATFGEGHALVIATQDIRSNLGVEIANAIAAARLQENPQGSVQGIVLDIRNNGGGSIDGAKDALSIFLPGANLFPMRRRRGPIEIEQAPTPASTDVWLGPVAAIVDGNTASAAEMIAGALAAYGRGVVIGSRTFGKGCAQEYLEDFTGVGILRLTTIKYALPNGRPVQRVGLVPDVIVDFPVGEREDAIPNAIHTWKGPDVRTPSLVRKVPWPSHHGSVGPCEDEVVCIALTRLGAARTRPATSHSRTAHVQSPQHRRGSH